MDGRDVQWLPWPLGGTVCPHGGHSYQRYSRVRGLQEQVRGTWAEPEWLVAVLCPTEKELSKVA